MHPFALLRVDDPAKAIAAHAEDAQLAFIAGGTDLSLTQSPSEREYIDLMGKFGPPQRLKRLPAVAS